MRTIRRVYRKLFRKRSYALNQLDLRLKPYLNFRKGFFIEAGANDGVKQSNTLYYEKYLDWSGILIEGIPELAEKCRTNRPKAIVEHCGLVPFGFPHSSITMQYSGLMSVVKGALESEELEREHIIEGIKLQAINTGTYQIEVPARTIMSILDQHSIDQIDFFSLDVEGYELSVLRGLDLDIYTPTYLLIEIRHQKTEINSLLSPYYDEIDRLSDHDYLYRSRQKPRN